LIIDYDRENVGCNGPLSTLFRPTGVPTAQLREEIIVKEKGNFTVNTGAVTIEQLIDFFKAQGSDEPTFIECYNCYLTDSILKSSKSQTTSHS